jgi:hypothetical protein
MADLDIPRIKANVGKMIALSAPETEIDAYLQSEGASAEMLRAAKPAPKITKEEMAKLSDEEVNAISEGRQPTLAPQKPSYVGGILPFSTDAKGRAQFDSNAGLLGMVKGAVTLPGDVYAGKVDPRSSEATGRVLDAASLATPVGPAARIGEKAIPGVAKALRKEQPAVPTTDELLAAGGRGLDAAKGMGVDRSAQSVSDLAQQIQANLYKNGAPRANAKAVYEILDELANPPHGSFASVGDLHSIRQALRGAGEADGQHGRAAKMAIEALDSFITNADPKSIVAGAPSAQRAGETFKEGLGNYAAGMRSDAINGIEENAARRAGATNSGLNADNNIRSRIASLLERPDKTAGFSGSELAGLENVARGSVGRNMLRWGGNLISGGQGLAGGAMASVGGAVGGIMGGPAGAAIGAAAPVGLGLSAKMGGNALTRRALSGVDEAVRMRSPLYEQALRDAPNVPISPEKRAAIIRALMLSGQSGDAF